MTSTRAIAAALAALSVLVVAASTAAGQQGRYPFGLRLVKSPAPLSRNVWAEIGEHVPLSPVQQQQWMLQFEHIERDATALKRATDLRVRQLAEEIASIQTTQDLPLRGIELVEEQYRIRAEYLGSVRSLYNDVVLVMRTLAAESQLPGLDRARAEIERRFLLPAVTSRHPWLRIDPADWLDDWILLADGLSPGDREAIRIGRSSGAHIATLEAFTRRLVAFDDASRRLVIRHERHTLETKDVVSRLAGEAREAYLVEQQAARQRFVVAAQEHELALIAAWRAVVESAARDLPEAYSAALLKDAERFTYPDWLLAPVADAIEAYQRLEELLAPGLDPDLAAALDVLRGQASRTRETAMHRMQRRFIEDLEDRIATLHVPHARKAESQQLHTRGRKEMAEAMVAYMDAVERAAEATLGKSDGTSDDERRRIVVAMITSLRRPDTGVGWIVRSQLAHAQACLSAGEFTWPSNPTQPSYGR